MTRIGTFGANQLYISRMTNLQDRVNLLSEQVTTGKKSARYSGIGTDTNQLINLETQKSRIEQFISDNKQADTKVQAMDVALTSIRSTFKNFRNTLDSFNAGNRDQVEVESIQDRAFQAMQDLRAALSTNVDGEYLFAGGRSSVEPVQLPADQLSDFQAIYDGFDHTFPTTRAGQMLDKNVTTNFTYDGATGTITASALTTSPNALSDLPVGSRFTLEGGANNGKAFTVRGVTVNGTGTHISVSPLTTGGPAAGTVSWRDANDDEQPVLSPTLTFDPGEDTIEMNPPPTGWAAGQVFTVGGSGANNGTYQVQSIAVGPPYKVTIQSTKVTTNAVAASATLKAEDWYKGDTLTSEHRVDMDRQVKIGVFASDPAFEKAFRAMGLIAQGQFGTAGGLENHPERLKQAMYLIMDALESPAAGTPPFGKEERSDLESLEAHLGNIQSILDSKNKEHTNFIKFIDTKIIDIENVDMAAAIVMMKDDLNALQASYQTMAAVRQSTLLDFL